jgi:hypothetical protein
VIDDEEGEDDIEASVIDDEEGEDDIEASVIGWSWPISQGDIELSALGYFFYRNLFSISFPKFKLTNSSQNNTFSYNFNITTTAITIPPTNAQTNC